MGVATPARDVAIDDYGLCTSEDLQRGWLPPESDYNKIQMGGSYGIREPSDLETCDHIVGKGNVSWWFVVTCNPAVTSDNVFFAVTVHTFTRREVTAHTGQSC